MNADEARKLEHKAVRVEQFLGPEPALEIIRQAIALYRKTFKARRKKIISSRPGN